MTTLRPSLAATTLAVISMVVMLLTSALRGLMAPAILISLAALLATHFTSARLHASSPLPLLIRLLVFPAIFFLSGSSSFGIDWLFDQRTLFMLGQLASVELVLQHWKHVPSVEKGRFPAVSVLLSSLAFLAGANVYSFLGSYIVAATPIFVGTLGWALVDWKPGALARRGRWVLGASWVLALGSGWVLHTVSMQFKDALMNVGSQFLQGRSLPQIAGISNKPSMSSRFEVTDSPRRVLRVEGSLQDAHLRAASFSFYDGKYWGPSLSGQGADARDIENDVPGVHFEPRPEKRSKQPPSTSPGTSSTSPPPARITRLLDMTDSPVFAPLNARGLRVVDSTQLDGPTFSFEADSGLLRNDEPSPFTYEVFESEQNVAGIPTFQGPLCYKLSDSERAKYLQLPPEMDARVEQIANEATINDDTPAERVESLARYLITNHKYALDIRIDESREPVSQFLIEKKAAHCEFFAAGLALMCRSVGVPARYVVGYLAHEPAAGQPGVTNVRQRDSHAWTEIWIDGVGWITADATPGDGRPASRAEAPATQKWSEWFTDFVSGLRRRAASIPRSTWNWVIGVPLALWILLRARPQGGFGRRTQSRGYGDREGETEERLQKLARDFEKYLSRCNLAPPPSRSWSWFLAREQKTAEERWARAYEAARFGQPDASEVAALEEGFKRLRART
jgi:transglutaminase-like putative cysteine protease